MIKNDVGGELTDLPNEKYKKFFEKFKEIDLIKIEDYKPAHLIAYWAQKYKNHYNVDYKFKFNSPSPSKCFEIFQIKKLSQMMTSNPVLLKQYIDWIFENQIVKAKRRITSISFITTEEHVNYYKLNILLAPKLGTTTVNRSTELPEQYKQLLSNCSTYGDLSFLFQSNQNNDIFIKLQELGLDLELLKKIV